MSEEQSAFALMPFEDEFNILFDEILRPVLKEAGFESDKADTKLDQENVMKKVITGIAKADLIIADLTTSNPNVFYELGIAHSLNCKTILITQAIDSVPFDLRGYNLVKYSTRFDKMHEFRNELLTIACKAKEGTIAFGNPVSDAGLEQSLSSIPREVSLEKVIENTMEASEISAEKGLIDFMAESEEAMEKVSNSIAEFSSATEILGTGLSEKTDIFNKLASGPPQGRAFKIRQAATAVSKDLHTFSNRTENSLTPFHEAWQNFEVNVISMLDRVDAVSESDVNDLKMMNDALKGMRDAMGEAKQGVNGLLLGFDGIKGLSRDLNVAQQRSANVVDKLVSEMEIADAIASKILAAVELLILAKKDKA